MKLLVLLLSLASILGGRTTRARTQIMMNASVAQIDKTNQAVHYYAKALPDVDSLVRFF